MPKRLLARCQPDSIREFRIAAHQRFNDALALSVAGNRTAAIYLWGYSAEMILKTAYFVLKGMAENTSLTWRGDIFPAINYGRSVRGIMWPSGGQGHNVRAWAELLVLERALIPGMAYSPEIGQEVQACGQRIGQLWNETLRYHKDLAYQHEVTQVRQATEWLLTNSSVL
jgi:hypothetical protein